MELEVGKRYLISEIQIDNKTTQYGLQEIECVECSQYAYRIAFEKPLKKNHRRDIRWIYKTNKIGIVETLK
jgi:hypothetical protein